MATLLVFALGIRKPFAEADRYQPWKQHYPLVLMGRYSLLGSES
jgi:hypothetical protein